jgi:uncharacterized protein (DUF885 family)
MVILSSVTTLSKPTKFAELVEGYFNGYFAHNPTAATAAGFHQYDQQMEDYSKDEVTRLIKFNNDWLTKLNSLSLKDLSADDKDDRELLVSSIQASLLELENIKSWEKNPDHYSSGLSASIFGLISRNFASQEERLKSVITREKKAPLIFAAARENLKNPPQIFTQIAMDQIPGIVSFFEKDVVQAFSSVKDENLNREFRIANDKVIEELKSFALYLLRDVLPRSHGDFKLGKENYGKKLLYEEMVDIPLDKLLEVGRANLKLNQDALKKTAALIDPKKAFSEIFAEQSKDHPAPDELLQSFRDVLGGLKNFLSEHHIVTVPSPVLPIVEETPAFMRALTLASMDTPGPYENKATEAYFNVTLAEKNWPPQEIEEHMQGFTRAIISSTASHEAYPGHYVQFLWLKKVKSKVRKLIGCSSNAEGWAHYSEQMVLDEGFGNHDPKLRLGQITDALLRNARYIVGIQMHTGKMTYDQAIDFFVNEGFQSRTNAEREVKRGTSDPTYLVYTLGKLQILKLRDDYKAKMGKKFTLQKFHDEFLKQGFPPIKLIRRKLLGSDSPSL